MTGTSLRSRGDKNCLLKILGRHCVLVLLSEAWKHGEGNPYVDVLCAETI